MLEQAFTLITNEPGKAGQLSVDEATPLQGNEEDVERAMLWGTMMSVEVSGFRLNIGDKCYRVFIEEME